MPYRAVLTDIEGTTSSISFVKDVLFPYARAHLPAFVRAHADEPAVQEALAQTAREAGLPSGADRETLIAVLLRWIDEDRKVTPLKALQGMVWEDGYAQRAFVAHMYPDAVAALQRWRAAGLELYVYSSGSVQAQRLYFIHTDHGDLSGLFSGHFDTVIGPKREAESYARIAAAIALPATEIVFLSDVEAELDAARAAGLGTVWVQREAAGRDRPPSAHIVVHRFDEVALP
jgi:enolase-phosphatase E1